MTSTRIYLSSPDVGRSEEEALVRAIRSGWVAPLGPEVDGFEADLATYCERTTAVALSSGTAALHLGLVAMGVGAQDLVVTSTLTFAATTNAITYTGAQPILVDCDESGNMCPELLSHALTTLEREGQRVRLVLPVDLLGKVADHARIAEAAAATGAVVLSDAAESLGATRQGRPAPAFGVAAGVSFNGNKVMTTSGGGALLTDDTELADHVRYLATQARQPVPHYEHTDIGYNYRMSNLLAALGRAQLDRLDAMISRRRSWRERYRALFAPVPGVSIFADQPDDSRAETSDNCWLTSIIVDPVVAGFSRDDLRLHLQNVGIEARPLWKPMHMQPVFAGLRSFTTGTSQRFFETGLSLPSGSALSDEQFASVEQEISSFLEKYSAS